MAAPREMFAFAQYLYGQGFTVYAPRLAGHGTAPEDLAQTRYEQWVDSAEEAYVVLRHSCSKIVIGGFSTGAGLALELAGRVEDYEAIFAVAPPHATQRHGGRILCRPLTPGIRSLKKIRLSSGAKEFIENCPENPHINYIRNPIAGVRQLEKLMDQLEPKLKKLKKTDSGCAVEEGSRGQPQGGRPDSLRRSGPRSKSFISLILSATVFCWARGKNGYSRRLTILSANGWMNKGQAKKDTRIKKTADPGERGCGFFKGVI